MSPRVSLGLPVYNGSAFIEAAIHSILEQSFGDFELVITDNASTDRTEDICRAFAASDSRIRYFRNEANLGAAANFNRAFELSSGEYFKWCSHDDCISRNYLEECVRALDRNADAVIAYGKQQGIDEHGRLIPWVSSEPLDVSRVSAADRFQMVFPVQGFDAAMFGLLRREALAKSSLHRNYYGSDIALLAEMALLGRFLLLPNATFFNREHPHRSIHIVEQRARQLWHDPRAADRAGLEHLSMLLHLLKIASRHRRVAPLHRTVLPLLVWAMTPFQLARYALDLIGVVSPPLRRFMRRVGRQTLNTISNPESPVRLQRDK